METGMEEKKPTRRKIQADSTRKKLYDISIAFMEKKGLANTTIAEISRKAGVSVGTFYNYFTSKDDIYVDIFKKADDYFHQKVAKYFEDSNMNAGDQIVQYFRFYARYNQRRGLANITHLYNAMSRFFAVKGRYMQELLKEIIKRGQAKAELVSDINPEDITEYLFIASRGVVFDWCVHKAKYNLEQNMTAYIRRLLLVFLNRKRDQ
jgi:TetR/AcrR family fatty acid metabolism transcriptional regulator